MFKSDELNENVVVLGVVTTGVLVIISVAVIVAL